ncbi:alpha/beta fold hydrolase [Georgenia alba]|uniref:Alpha/beta fold hydrolase n=1 Tax=Georgenia alba TaxID=2233858 RepID=A0ABW2QA14_9MICO
MPSRTVAAPGPDPVLLAEHRPTVAGAATSYRVWGDPDAATTLVAVHGFRGDHHGLLPIVAHLPGHRVITPDLPGFGESAPFPGTHDLAAYAAWLTELCDLLRSGFPDTPVALLGHSFGSVVAAAAVAGGLRPDRLVLVNPIAAPALQGRRAVLSAIAVGYYRLGARLPAALGNQLLANRAVVRAISQLMVTTRQKPLRRWIHDQHHRYFSGYADRRVVLEAFSASVSHDVAEHAAGLTVPTLLVAGDRDDLVPVPAVERLHRAVPGSRLEILPGVGHLIHYERPAAAAALIGEFLGGGAPPQGPSRSASGPGSDR